MNSSITHISISSFPQEPQALGYGCIVLCRRGNAVFRIEFEDITLNADESLTLFPTDIVQMISLSEDFEGVALNYSDRMLREASMHMEQSVYSSLRKDRICHEKVIISDVLKPMFCLLAYFLGLEDCKVKEDIVLQQLKSFFMGFYDFLRRHPERQPAENESQRTNELFAKFMKTLEYEYLKSRDVQYYADRLFITRKYLGMIVRRKTDKTPKMLINEYVITQIKLRLRNTNDSIRQISNDFHFADDSLMIRYFKSHTKLTPAQYRRRTEY